MNELWKKIEESTNYEVSNLGRIRNTKIEKASVSDVLEVRSFPGLLHNTDADIWKTAFVKSRTGTSRS